MTLLGTPLWLWAVFGGIVIALLSFDLGVLHRRAREPGVRESLWLSFGYIAVALVFAAWLAWYQGSDSGMAFLAGYLIEKTLALDNVFLIAVVFATVGVPRQYQHKVLFWGILGVIISRALLIGLGVTLVSHFSWISWLFGIFLVVTGVRMFQKAQGQPDNAIGPWLTRIRRHLRVTDGFHGGRFWVKAPPRDDEQAQPVLWATPLLLALILIEVLDLIFAVDSVPAILAITQDPFVVYTSNIFAILGLRALYFCLAILMARFHYLHHALAAILVFIGGKSLAADWLGKLPVWVSLSVVLGLLAAGVLYSLYRTSSGWRLPSRSY